MSYPIQHVYFNDYDIASDTKVLITKRDPHQVPTRTLSSYPLTRSDGEVLTHAQYDKRVIEIAGVIAATTRDAFEQSRDTLLQKLTGLSGRLEFVQSGSLRRYFCTFTDSAFTEVAGGYGVFSLKFGCYNPFGYDTSVTTYLNSTAQTTTANSKAITIGGSYTVWPVITITLNSLTGTGNQTVTLTNTVTGDAISILRTWTGADVLVIDCANKSVTVNGVATAYSGVFPYFAAGAGTIKYDDTFSARNYTFNVTGTNRWL